MQANDSAWQICAQTDDRLGESILWHPTEQALYWIDYYGPYIHRQKQPKGPVERWKIDGGEIIGSLVFAGDGLLALAMDHGLYLFDTSSGDLRFFADPKNGRMDLAYNDGKVDRAGRYWVGTLNLAETVPNGAFYRVAPDGRAMVMDEGFIICNGPAFSPDNRKLYFSDSVGRRILAYDLDLGGAISGRRVFFSFSSADGMPDGLTVDGDGNVWCALYGGAKVVCIDAEGVLKLSLPVPAALVTSLCFGGPALKTLYVTTGSNTGGLNTGGSNTGEANIGTADAAEAKDRGGAVFMRPVDRPGLPEPVMTL